MLDSAILGQWLFKEPTHRINADYTQTNPARLKTKNGVTADSFSLLSNSAHSSESRHSDLTDIIHEISLERDLLLGKNKARSVNSELRYPATAPSPIKNSRISILHPLKFHEKQTDESRHNIAAFFSRIKRSKSSKSLPQVPHSEVDELKSSVFYTLGTRNLHIKERILSSHNVPIFKDSEDHITSLHQNLSYFDRTYLPRTFQHHKLDKTFRASTASNYRYFENRFCPKSSNVEIPTLLNLESNNHHKRNLITYRYSRRNVRGPSRKEVLCRLCRGQNWLPKQSFSDHLAFAHGVLVPGRASSCFYPGSRINNIKKIHLLPLPSAIYAWNEGPMKNYSVKCAACSKWILLGFPASDESSPSNTKIKGLYYKYFYHYLQFH